jgi:hypothetical protein
MNFFFFFNLVFEALQPNPYIVALVADLETHCLTRISERKTYKIH